jgi:flagellar protein FlbD
MIHLTRINHVALVLNSDLIEHIESSPDTIITLTNGQKFVVLEPVEDVVHKVIEFRRAILPMTQADRLRTESNGQ